MQDNPTPKEETLALLRRIADGFEQLLESSTATLEASATTAEALARFAESIPNTPQPSAPSQPAGEYRDFLAEAIVMTYNDRGEPAYKLVGHPYSKYGVRVWPEVLPILGVDPDSLQPGPNPFSSHVRALMGERGPKKITGLAPGSPPPPAQPAEPPDPPDYPF